MAAPLAPARLRFLANDLATTRRMLARIDSPAELLESTRALAAVLGAIPPLALTIGARANAPTMRADADARQLVALGRALEDVAAVAAGLAEDLERAASIGAGRRVGCRR